ncbi:MULTISPECIES: AzlD family protein [unclassified Rhizobium]|uniref:AzlD family protein n=1 Tax=unclassified Rhizobium TaxID=2613769 RepID=UPI001C8341AD|nr:MULTISPECIES: AzlD family protein [unclassified Rhizobium]MBX5166927.1 AzlD family protein [Rhizobium sp. NZLR4b]MBX5172366.1 AzlD family protein [Rhizobium sp. NZLR1b]MBX5211074.1 AzlD family protein [Rhizobium sp. NZLR11]
MADPLYLTAIVLMATLTYLTRIGGYLFLRNRALGPRLRIVMESAPGCVLITVIAPDFVTGRPADLIALAVTMLAAARLPVLPTVIIAIAAAGILRHALV